MTDLLKPFIVLLKMQIINNQLLNSITQLAKESPRLRMNYNLHTSLDAKAQRLLNALEPGTVLPIHRHLSTAETYILLRGKIEINFYNNQKKVTETIELDPFKNNYGIQIPAGQWHSLKVLESGSVLFEVKDGPYTPITPENILE